MRTGPLFTSAFAVVIIYSIFRYRLFNVETIVGELLVFSLWLIIPVPILISSLQGELLADIILLDVSVSIGILLLRSIGLEV